jgi:streptogrisin C
MRAGPATRARPAPRADGPAGPDLATVKARLDDLAQQRGAPREVTAWWVDPVTRSVVLAVDHQPRDARAAAYVDDARRIDPRIRLVEGVRTVTPRAGIVGGDAIYLGGARCSVGFSARTRAGASRMITAGHCTRSGGDVRGADNRLIGEVRSSVFDRTGDWGVADVGDGWQATPQVSAAGTTIVRVTGTGTAAVGAPVCRSGSTTGWRCGAVIAVDVTANYDTGPVLGLTMTSACSEPGDSGGPFVSGTLALGTLSGGSGDCGVAGGDTLYQPIDEVLAQEGLSLVTG